MGKKWTVDVSTHSCLYPHRTFVQSSMLWDFGPPLFPQGIMVHLCISKVSLVFLKLAVIQKLGRDYNRAYMVAV